MAENKSNAISSRGTRNELRTTRQKLAWQYENNISSGHSRDNEDVVGDGREFSSLATYELL